MFVSFAAECHPNLLLQGHPPSKSRFSLLIAIERKLSFVEKMEKQLFSDSKILNHNNQSVNVVWNTFPALISKMSRRS